MAPHPEESRAPLPPLRADAVRVAPPRGPSRAPVVAGLPAAAVGLPAGGLVSLWHPDGRYTVHPVASSADDARLTSAVRSGSLPRTTVPDGAQRFLAGVAYPDGVGEHWSLAIDESGAGVVHLGPPLPDPPTDDDWAPLIGLVTDMLRSHLGAGERVVLTYGGWSAVDPRTYVAAAVDDDASLVVQAVPAPPLNDATWAPLRSRRLRLGVAAAPYDDDAPEGAAALMISAISQWSAPWTTAFAFYPPGRARLGTP